MTARPMRPKSPLGSLSVFAGADDTDADVDAAVDVE